jgi:hypothetical protein
MLTASTQSRPWRAKAGRPPSVRQPLRKAVAAAQDARRRLDAHRTAIDRARRVIVPEALAALQSLQRDEADAKAILAQDLAISLGGVAGSQLPVDQVPPESLAVAGERVATARAALAHLQATLPDAEHAVALAENQVLVEINLLMVPIIRKLLHEGEKNRRRFVAARAALRALSRDFKSLPKFAEHDAVSIIGAAAARAEALGGLQGEAESFGHLGMYRGRDEESEIEFQVPALWQQAREELRCTPNAALPKIE